MKQSAKNSNMTKKDFNFQLRNIDVIEVILKHPEKQLPKECQYNFDINIQHNITDKDNLIVVAPTILIRINNEEIIYGKFKANIFFQVQNLDDFKNQDNSKFDIPDPFITTLNSISISTLRGLMFLAFKGTFLHNAILPIVNPDNF